MTRHGDDAGATPDLLGITWAEAEPLLAARGLTYETALTGPPGKGAGIGDLRVVAQRQAPGRLVLILAHREYGVVEAE